MYLVRRLSSILIVALVCVRARLGLWAERPGFGKFEIAAILVSLTVMVRDEVVQVVWPVIPWSGAPIASAVLRIDQSALARGRVDQTCKKFTQRSKNRRRRHAHLAGQ